MKQNAARASDTPAIRVHKFYPANAGRVPEVNRLQRSFYNRTFRPRLLAGDPIDVDGQDGYGLVMFHELLAEVDTDTDTASAGLVLLERAYPRSSAGLQARDCLCDIALLRGQWADALIRANSFVLLPMILGLAEELGHPRINPIDILLWSGRGLTNTGYQELGSVIEKLGNDLDNFHDVHGISLMEDFWNRLAADGPTPEIVASVREEVGPDLDDEDIAWSVETARRLGLYYEPDAFTFHGQLLRKIPLPRPWPRPEVFGCVWRGFLKALVRTAENDVRADVGLPLVGEGLVGEMRLLNELRAAFPEEDIRHQVRPPWLAPQSLDIVFADRRIAVEYQGVQHSRPVDYFGGTAAFEALQMRDTNKRWLCQANRMQLLEVQPDYALSVVVEEIRTLLDEAAD